MKFWSKTAVCAAIVSAASLLHAEGDAGDKFYNAIRNDDRKAVAKMILGGASVNNKDGRGATPLMYAAASGSVETMRQLIASGADVNAKDEFGATALMWCSNQPEKVKLLVAKGADVNAVNKQGRTPLIIAAAHQGNLEVIQLLLAKGADAKAKDAMGTTPVIAAADANDEAAVRLLLEKGADVNGANVGGFTPLISAASRGNAVMVKMLLDRHANVNAATGPSFDRPVKNGPIALGYLTPLLVSVTATNSDVVKMLLDAGAEVNAQDVRGMTPIMLAVATDHPNETTVRMLLERKPDMSIKSKAGETAMDWAAKYRQPTIMAAIAEASKGIQAKKAAEMPFERAHAKTPQEAVARSLAVMQKTNVSFFKEGGCISCHAQNVTSVAVAAARAKGVAYDQPAEEEVAKGTRLQFAAAADFLLQRMDPPVPDILTFALQAMNAEGTPADRVTDSMVHNLAAQQHSDGAWGNFGITRPPTSDGNFTLTAMAIRGLRDYMPPARRPEFEARIARAAKWLVEKEPQTTEDAVMQMLGAKWAGLDKATVERFSKRVLALQRADGGWGQTRYLDTDAYATGRALQALQECGTISAADPAYRKGVRFLMDTQAADGTWHVRSRAPKIQPYFESGFPYGHDQWLSQMGTAFASAAIIQSLPEVRAAAK